MLEKDIEKRLTAEIRKKGGIAYKWTSPGNTGVPDRIIVMPKGRVYFVELKTDTGRLSEIQKKQIDRLRLRGCDVRVLYVLEQVEEFIKEVTGCST